MIRLVNVNSEYICFYIFYVVSLSDAGEASMGSFQGKRPFQRMSEKWKDIILNLKSKGLYTKFKIRSIDKLQESKQWLIRYKIRVAGVIGVALLISGAMYAGNAYVQANMNEIYKVYFNDQYIGEVSSPDVVDRLIAEKQKQMEEEHPEVQWEVESDGIRIEKESVYKGQSADEETASMLLDKLEAKAIGVELVVNGETMAIVKDEETAERILEQVKSVFASAEAPEGLTVLSADPVKVFSNTDDVLTEGKPEVKSTRIVEPVEIMAREIQPNDVMDEQAVIDMLIQGDVKPTQYIVQEGDTPLGIAYKLDIPIEVIYSKNQDHKDLIERDLIRPGDVLDVTMLQPAVTIETVEEVTDTIAIQYETNYVDDETMRKGQTETIREGQNGIKKVTFEITRINGLLMEEKIINETIVKEAVPAVVKRGTKVIKGEGTGSFSWPVVSPQITSSFGKRWGRQHKGIDIVSKNKSILAADTGVVTFAGDNGDYGKCIIIDHKNGYETLYAHLSKISVKEGDIVEKGDKIGTMGNTGRSTGVHLHFEIIVNDVAKNPMSYLR